MVKVGDKVRVTTDRYSPTCPRSSVCTVVDDWDGGGQINATIDGGGGFPWFFYKGDYEPFTDEPETLNYAEQAAKHGISITVEFANGDVIVFDGKK